MGSDSTIEIGSAVDVGMRCFRPGQTEDADPHFVEEYLQSWDALDQKLVVSPGGLAIFKGLESKKLIR